VTDARAPDEDHELRLVDPRLVFLARAAAKHYLVEAGLEELAEAFDDLSRACRMIAPCACELATLRAWATADQKLRQQRLQKWRVRPAWAKRSP
jgi:hypothetical protein